MKHYLITPVPDDPKLGDYGLIAAENQLEALDKYAVSQGFAPYSDASPEEFQEAVGVDKYGLWALCGNHTIWAIETKPSFPHPIAQLRYEGLTVSLTRNTETRHGQLIVLINTEEVGDSDHDDEGQPYIEVSINDMTLLDYERPC